MIVERWNGIPFDRPRTRAREVVEFLFNFLPLASVDKVLERVRAGEQAAGKGSGSVETLCRFFCLAGDPEQTIGLARWMFCA